MPGLTNVHEERVTTPFGDPSDPFVLGDLEGRKVAFLARHGRGHRILPSELNFRANIYGMKKLGVERIVSVSAVGSLKEEHKPGDFVVPDQFIDRTFLRISTFFGDGIVAHVGFGDPVCSTVAKAIYDACKSEGVEATARGTYVCMEGPQFSTRAESNLYRSWGANVIGMTNLQEAKLAREAEICYATAGHGDRLRLLARGPRRRHHRPDRESHEPELSQRQPRGEDGRGRHAARPQMRLQLGIAVRDAHQSRCHSPGHARQAGPADRKVSEEELRNHEEQSNPMAILVVGSVAFDSIETPSGRRERCVGGAATHFALAASYFTSVRIIGVVGEDFGPEEESVLTRHNIDTRGIEHVPGKSFFWSGSYMKNLNEAQTLNTELNVFQSFSPKIPARISGQRVSLPC